MKNLTKTTINKTYFYTDNSFIYYTFGKDGDDKDYIITDDNIEYLREYIDDYIEEYGDNGLREILLLIENELEKVNEIQFVRA